MGWGVEGVEGGEPSIFYRRSINNGTPDLRNRFVIGAIVDSGSTAATNITGANTQTGGTKDAVVVAHTHTYSWNHGPASAYGPGNRSWNNGGGHTDGAQLTINSEGVSGINQNLPPYYALAFIMRIS
jgi:hypothetical protein